MSRPLADFLKSLPSDTVSLALRVGERANPKDAGYVELTDFGGLPGLDVELLARELAERFEAAGWPVDWPCARLEAKPEPKGAGKMSTSWQDTQSGGRQASAPVTGGDAFMYAAAIMKDAMKGVVDHADRLATALVEKSQEADEAKAAALEATVAAERAQVEAELAELKSELGEGADAAGLERGVNALERLAGVMRGGKGAAGGLGEVSADDLLETMTQAPDEFYDAVADDPRLQGIIERALARKAAKGAPAAEGKTEPPPPVT